MRCVQCGEETSLSEARSYLDLTFGLLRKAFNPPTEAEEAAVRVIARHYQPALAMNWHGAGNQAHNEPYPGIYPGVEINAEHDEAPQPPLRDLQADLFYCSPDCLRKFLNRMVDELEKMLRAGVIDGQVTNLSYSGRPH